MNPTNRAPLLTAASMAARELMPQILTETLMTLTGSRGDLGDDGGDCLGGIGGFGDRPADDEIVGAGGDRLRGAHDAFLVADGGAPGADARHHEAEAGS